MRRPVQANETCPVRSFRGGHPVFGEAFLGVPNRCAADLNRLFALELVGAYQRPFIRG